jgi:dihydrodipicolinate synthase/N-acetylneuraminate lyase
MIDLTKNIVKGAVTELVATFDKNEKLDLGMFENEVDFQLEAGIKGLFTGGLASESLYTTQEERAAMTRVTVKKAKGKVPVIGNIVELRPSDAHALLKAYEDAGVDAVCVTQPYVIGYTQDTLCKYFSDLAESTKLPVYVYNAPQTSNTLTPGTVTKIANNNENVVGYKDSTQDIIHLQSVQAGIKAGKHWECVSGSDATIFPTLAVGGCGIISLISAVFPKPIIDICEIYFSGDIEGAFEKQKEILEIRTALKGAPFLAGYKYASSLIGLPLGIVRAPLSDASDAEKAKIKENLTRLGLIK